MLKIFITAICACVSVGLLCGNAFAHTSTDFPMTAHINADPGLAFHNLSFDVIGDNKGPDLIQIPIVDVLGDYDLLYTYTDVQEPVLNPGVYQVHAILTSVDEAGNESMGAMISTTLKVAFPLQPGQILLECSPAPCSIVEIKP